MPCSSKANSCSVNSMLQSIRTHGQYGQSFTPDDSELHLRGKVIHQPLVLWTGDREVIIAGEVDHMCRPNIHRVVQRVVGPTLVVGGGVASHIGPKLQPIVEACDIYT